MSPRMKQGGPLASLGPTGDPEIHASAAGKRNAAEFQPDWDERWGPCGLRARVGRTRAEACTVENLVENLRSRLIRVRVTGGFAKPAEAPPAVTTSQMSSGLGDRLTSRNSQTKNHHVTALWDEQKSESLCPAPMATIAQAWLSCTLAVVGRVLSNPSASLWSARPRLVGRGQV